MTLLNRHPSIRLGHMETWLHSILGFLGYLNKITVTVTMTVIVALICLTVTATVTMAVSVAVTVTVIVALVCL